MRISMTALLLGLGFMFASSLPPALADADDRRLEALLMLEDAFPDPTIRELAQPVVEELLLATALRRPDVDTGAFLALGALYLEDMQRAAREAMGAHAGALAGHYTLDEIAALRDFAVTEDGEALLWADGGILAQVQAGIDGHMMDAMDAALERYAPRP